MIKIEHLTGIPEKRRNEAVQCLDELLTFKDDQGRLSPVITGYNWYSHLVESDRVIIFSHIHETEDYKQDMLRDLKVMGYDPQTVLKQIRDKTGAFLWNPEYRIRDDKGNVLNGLKIKDMRTGQYINLNEYDRPLKKYPQYATSKGHLVAENRGWELDIPFNTKTELRRLVDLFLRKSGLFIYDENGVEILESDKERKARAHWSDAYETPLLVLGKAALEYAADLPHFDQATKTSLIENDNEIGFIIHKKLGFLRTILHYEQLKRLGFQEEVCMGNKPFLKSIDNPIDLNM